MILQLTLAFILTLPGSLPAITLYLPFCTSPCQTTKGPGSYGKSPSDIRYRDGWNWKPLSDRHPHNSARPRSCVKRTKAS